MKPGPRLLQRLKRTRLLTRSAVASAGIGERKSRNVGSGVDFADYREYVPGDETRHLDARLYARHGKYFVRQFDVERQLPVTLVVDASRSMLTGAGEKLALARWLAGALGYVALTGGDRTQCAVWTGRGLEMSPMFSGARQYPGLIQWLDGHGPQGQEPFEVGLSLLVDHLPNEGLLIVMSDFWLDQPEETLVALGARNSELWALQVLSRQELDPALAAQGELTLLDAESGQALDLALNGDTLRQYRDLLSAHNAALGDAVAKLAGRYHLLATDTDPEHFVLSEMRSAGMIRGG